jgi:hypothetical protein
MELTVKVFIATGQWKLLARLGDEWTCLLFMSRLYRVRRGHLCKMPQLGAINLKTMSTISKI